MQTLNGRTCVFAGATAGDGRDTVKALCLGSMNVVMMTHNPAPAESLIAEVKALNAPGDCCYFAGREGMGPAEHDPAVYAEIEQKYGSVDVIICNTGADGHIDDLETLSPEELQKNMNHLVIGSFKMMQAALPYLKKSKAPRVILMTTTEALHGGTQESLANAIGKGAVASLALNAAARLAAQGITVNCIAKGAIQRIGPVHPGVPDPADRLASIPMNRLGTPRDLANTICFLVSEEASYITGQMVELSGGLNLGR